MNLTNTLAHISTWPQKYVEWETDELMMKYNSIPLNAHLSHVQQLCVLDQPLQGIHTQAANTCHCGGHLCIVPNKKCQYAHSGLPLTNITFMSIPLLMVVLQ